MTFALKPNPPCLDAVAVAYLREVMGAKFNDILTLYLKDAAERLAALPALLSEGGEELTRAAHSLKSSSAHVGAAKLSALAADLENAAIAARPGAELAPVVEAIRAAYEETSAAIQALVKG